jgi:alpha-galactosidase/6-phospho-beta-glucosidase family protein
MKGPKVVVIGAGSLFFGRQAIWQMVTSEHLNSGTLALVDTDPTHLARMTALARKAIAHRGVALTLESSMDRREVLKGADFVVLSFAYKSVNFPSGVARTPAPCPELRTPALTTPALLRPPRRHNENGWHISPIR